MSLINLQRRFNELGRIRLGEKGPKGEPRRLTTFRLTSASRSLLESAAAIYGGTVREWKNAPSEGYYEVVTESAELDVLIPPSLGEQGPYSQAYELWSGGGAQRRCDGVTELLSGEKCLCDPDDRECEIMTRVSVMLPRVPGLGVWRLETSGYNAAVELPGTLDLLSMAAQGQRFIPAVLRLEQRTAKRPGANGQPQTRRFVVPVLDVKGTTAELMGPRIDTTTAPMPMLPERTSPNVSRTIDFGPEPELPDTDPGVVTAPASIEPAASPPGPLPGAAGSPLLLTRPQFREMVKEMRPGDVLSVSREMFPDVDPRSLTDEQRGQVYERLSQDFTEKAREFFPDAVTA